MQALARRVQTGLNHLPMNIFRVAFHLQDAARVSSKIVVAANMIRARIDSG